MNQDSWLTTCLVYKFSSLTEILQLWPKLQLGGIMVLDDYHSWQGCNKAFNEVFGNSLKIHTIDRTAIYVKKERP